MTGTALVRAVGAEHAWRSAIVATTMAGGMRQVVDLGCGLPAPIDGDRVHRVAAGIDPAARVIHVDLDATVVAHARARMAAPGTAAIRHDVRAAGAWDAIAGTQQWCPHDPVLVLTIAMTPLWSYGDVIAAATAARAATAPGSVLAVTVLTPTPDVGTHLTNTARTAGHPALHWRTADTLTALLATAGWTTDTPHPLHHPNTDTDPPPPITAWAVTAHH